MKKSISYIVCGLTILFFSCERLEIKRVDPSVTSISPSAAVPGTKIVMTGEHFITETKVTFNGVDGLVENATKTRLEVTIPTQIAPGIADVQVKAEGAPHGLQYEILTPQITSVEPSTAVPGTRVTFTGNFFTTNSTVVFADTLNAEIVEVTSTTLTAKIPLNAPAETLSVLVTGDDPQIQVSSQYDVLPFFEQLTQHPDGATNGAGFVLNDEIYFGTGGTNGNAPFNRYDPISNQWEVLSTTGAPTRVDAIGFAIGNKGYILAGRDPSNGLSYERSLWEYDPATDNFTRKADYPLERIFAGPAVFVIGDEAFFCAGFQDGISSTVYKYSQSTDEWTQMNDFPGGKRGETIGFVIGDKGYLAQGYDFDTNNPINDCWEYDATTDTWTEIAAPNPAANLEGGTGFGFNGKGYIGLGRTLGSEMVTEFWQYDPGLNSWSKFTEFEGTPRYGAQSFVAGNAAYMMNGSIFDPFTQLNELWRFTPETQ